MNFWDAAGNVASGLVVMAFCMKDIIPLRLTALASKIAFLIYGIGLGLVPVWLLHAILRRAGFPSARGRLGRRLASESKCLAVSDRTRVQGKTTNAQSSVLAVGPTSVRTDDRGRVTGRRRPPLLNASVCACIVYVTAPKA